MLDERTLVDASITYTGGDGAWFVRAFGNNLTDETLPRRLTGRGRPLDALAVRRAA